MGLNTKSEASCHALARTAGEPPSFEGDDFARTGIVAV